MADDFDDGELGDAFQHLIDTVPRGSFLDFVEDVYEQWQTRGRISQRQRETIIRAAQRQT